MARVADELVGTDVLESGRVLRIGTPQLDVARDRPEILPDRIIARQQPELATQQEALDAERRSLSRRLKAARSDAELDELTARLEEVRAAQAENEKRLREARAKLVRDATVIGATLSKLVIDDQLWSWPAATVIVDQAKRRAPLRRRPGDARVDRASATSGSCRASHLGRERAQQWFGRDVFTLSSVVSGPGKGRSRARHPTDRVPDGRGYASLVVARLHHRTGTDAPGRRRRRRRPRARSTSGRRRLGRSAACSGRDRSYTLTSDRSARPHARPPAPAGRDVAVGIVTPYRAQAQLLRP